MLRIGDGQLAQFAGEQHKARGGAEQRAGGLIQVAGRRSWRGGRARWREAVDGRWVWLDGRPVAVRASLAFLRPARIAAACSGPRGRGRAGSVIGAVSIGWAPVDKRRRAAVGTRERGNCSGAV